MSRLNMANTYGAIKIELRKGFYNEEDKRVNEVFLA